MRKELVIRELLIVLLIAINLVANAQKPVTTVKKIDITGISGNGTKKQTVNISGDESFSIEYIKQPPIDTTKKKDSIIITKSIIYSFNEGNREVFNPQKAYSLKGLGFLKAEFTIRDYNKDSAKFISEDTLVTTFIKDPDNGDTSLHNSSFVSASLIKSIAGTNIPENELLDISVKLNLGSRSRYFSLLGVDAGLGTTNKADSSTSWLNEAMVNFNVAFFSGLNLRTDSHKRDSVRKKIAAEQIGLKRTGFGGVGLKVFYNEAYIGAHLGLLEISGDLFGSYILGGFYHNPYTRNVALSDSSVKKFNYYPNNIYLEAGLNIFSKSNNQLSTFFNSIRFKFGLLFPMKSSGDALAPRTTDVVSRLSIEVPLGIKRF